MIKKYNYKIAGIASFAGIAMNNVKADNNNQKVHIKVGNNVYYKAKDVATDIKGVTDLDKLFELISNFGDTKKNGSDDTTKIDFTDSEKKYFVKEVKVSGDETNKLNDELKIDISAANNVVKITLVPKRERIKFKYSGAKELTTDNENALLEEIIQGKTLVAAKDDGLLSDNYETHKLENINLGDDTADNVVGGKKIKLFEANPCELVIDSDKIQADKFKTVVINFDDEAEKSLVSGLKLSTFDTFDVTTNINDNKGTTAFNKLNEVKVAGNDDDNKFFKGKFEILKGDDEKIKVASDNADEVGGFSGGSFYILKDIKKDNINAKYLKKTFDVNLDSTDNTKEVPSSKITELNNFLNEKLGNLLKITTKAIFDALKEKNTIINTSFKGQIKIGKGTSNPDVKACTEDNDLVDDKTTKFVIKLPVEAFAKDVVETKIKITCNLGNVKKDGKKLKEEVINSIKNILNTTLNKVTPISDIINALNNALKDKFVDSTKQITADDIEFTNVKDNNDIKKSGAITINGTFAGKLKDEYFDKPKEAEDGTNSTNTKNGSGANNGGKDPKKGCCGSNKK